MLLDLALVGGEVIDGTGAPARRIDVGIRGGKIAALGRIDPGPEVERLDVSGLVVTPGFIDIHSHSDYTLLVDPRAVSSVAQGVTLEVVGNCGYGCAPIVAPDLAAMAVYGALKGGRLRAGSMAHYLGQLEAARPAVNVMMLVPNGQLRLGFVGVQDRAATSEELEGMKRCLAQSLSEGAIGYSTGLEYAQERGATHEEVAALCRVVAPEHGLYATHTRNRDGGALEAIAEAIETARTAGVRLQVSHITPRTGMAATEQAIALVDGARAGGLEVAFDMHTRTFGFTHLKTLLPACALEGDAARVAGRLHDRAARDRFRAHPNLITGVGDWERVVLTGARERADLNGLSLAEIGRRLKSDPLEAAYDILLANVESLLEPMVILRTYDESVLAATYRHPLCMIGSDATALAPDGPLAGEVFHGAYTWAAWFWRRMVRELRQLTPESAIHRLTGLPARTLRLAHRGELRIGAAADIAIFDAARFGESGTIEHPNRLAGGMRHVLVNGKLAWRNGRLTGERAGSVIRGA